MLGFQIINGLITEALYRAATTQRISILVDAGFLDPKHLRI